MRYNQLSITPKSKRETDAPGTPMNCLPWSSSSPHEAQNSSIRADEDDDEEGHHPFFLDVEDAAFDDEIVEDGSNSENDHYEDDGKQQQQQGPQQEQQQDATPLPPTSELLSRGGLSVLETTSEDTPPSEDTTPQAANTTNISTHSPPSPFHDRHPSDPTTASRDRTASRDCDASFQTATSLPEQEVFFLLPDFTTPQNQQLHTPPQVPADEDFMDSSSDHQHHHRNHPAPPSANSSFVQQEQGHESWLDGWLSRLVGTNNTDPSRSLLFTEVNEEEGTNDGDGNEKYHDARGVEEKEEEPEASFSPHTMDLGFLQHHVLSTKVRNDVAQRKFHDFYEQELQSYQKQNQQEMEIATQRLQDLEQLVNSMQEEKVQLEEMVDHLNQTVEEAAAELETVNDDAVQRNEQITTLLQDYQEKLKHSQDSNIEKEQQLVTVQGVNQTLEEQVTVLTRQVETTTGQLSDMEFQWRTSHENDIAQLEEKNQTLNSTLQSTRWRMGHVLVLVNEEKEQLQTQVQNFESQMIQLQQDKTQFIEEAKEWKQKYQMLHEEFGTLQNAKATWERLLEESEDRMTRVSVQLKHSEESMERKDVIHQAEQEEWTQERQSLETEVTQYRTQLDNVQIALSSTSETVMSLRAEKDDLQHRHQETQQLLDDAKGRIIDVSRAMMQHEEDATQLRQQHEMAALEWSSKLAQIQTQAEEEVTQHKHQISHLQQELTKVQTQAAHALHEEQETSQRQCQELERLLDESEERATRVSNHLVHRDAESIRVRKRIEDLKLQRDTVTTELEQERKQTAKLQEEILSERSTKAQSLTEANAQQGHINELERLLEDSEERATRVSAHLVHREAQEENLRQQHQEAKTRLETIEMELGDEQQKSRETVRTVADLTRQLEDAGQQNMALQLATDTLTSQLEETQSTITTLKWRKDGLERELSISKNQERDLQTRMIATQRERAELTKRLGESTQALTTMTQEKSTLEERVVKLQGFIEAATGHMGTLNQQVVASKEKIETLEQENNTLRPQLEESRQALTSMTEEKLRLEQRVGKLQGYIESATGHMATLNEQIVASKDKIATLERENNILRPQLESSHEMVEGLIKEKDQVLNELETLLEETEKQTLVAQDTERQRLQEQKDEFDLKLASVSKELDEQKQQVEERVTEVTAQLNSMDEQKQQAEKRLAELTTQLKDAKEEATKWHTERDDLLSQLEKTKSTDTDPEDRNVVLERQLPLGDVEELTNIPASEPRIVTTEVESSEMAVTAQLNSVDEQKQPAEERLAELMTQLKDAKEEATKWHTERDGLLSQLEKTKSTDTDPEDRNVVLERQLQLSDVEELTNIPASEPRIVTTEAESSEVAKAVEQREQELNTAKEEKAALEKRVGELKMYIDAAAGDLADLEQKMLAVDEKSTAIQEENDVLRPQLQENHAIIANLSVQLSASNEKVESMQKDQDRTKLKLKKRETEVINLKSRVEEYTQATALAQEEKQALERQLQEFQSRHSNATRELTTARQNSQKWKEQYDKAVIQIQQFESYQAESTRLLEESEERASRVSVRLVHCEAELERVGEQGEASEVERVTNDELTEQMAALQRENENLSCKLQENQSIMANMEVDVSRSADLESALSSTEEKVRNLTTDNETYQLRLNEFKRLLDESEEHKSRVSTDLTNREAEALRLVQQIEASETQWAATLDDLKKHRRFEEQMRSEFELQRKELEAELNRLQKEKEASEVERVTTDMLTEQMAALQLEKDGLDSKLQENELRSANMEAELSRSAGLESVLSSTEENVRRLTAENETYQLRLKELERLLDESEERTTRVSAHLTNRETEVERLMQEKEISEAQSAAMTGVEEREIAELPVTSLRNLSQSEGGAVRALQKELDIEEAQPPNDEIAAKLQDLEMAYAVVQEEKSSLEDRVEKLKAYIDDATQQLTEFERQVVASDDEIAALYKDKNSLNSKLQEGMAIMEREMKRSETRIDDLESLLLISEGSAQGMKLERDESVLRTKALELQISDLESRLREKGELIASYKSKPGKPSKAGTPDEPEGATKEREKDNSKVFSSDVTREMTAMQFPKHIFEVYDPDALESDVESLKSLLGDSARRISEARQDAEKAKKEHDDAISQLRLVESAKMRLEGLLEDSEDRTTRISARLVHCEAELVSLLRQKETSESKIESLMEELQEQRLLADKAIEDFELQLNASKRQVSALQLDSLTSRLDKSISKSAKLEVEVEGLESQNTALENQMSRVEGVSQVLQEELTTWHLRVETLEAEKATQLQDSNRALEALQEEKSSLESQVEKLKAIVDDSAREVTEMRMRIDSESSQSESKAEVEALSARVEEMERELEVTRKERETLKSRLHEEEMMVFDVERKLKASSEEKDALLAEKESLVISLQDIQSTMGNVFNEMKAAASNIADLETQLNDAEEKERALLDEKAESQVRMREMESLIAESEARSTESKQAMEDVKEERSCLERIVEDLQADLGASHKESGELKQVAHTLKTERDEAQAKIKELQGPVEEIENLESRVHKEESMAFDVERKSKASSEETEALHSEKELKVFNKMKIAASSISDLERQLNDAEEKERALLDEKAESQVRMKEMESLIAESEARSKESKQAVEDVKEERSCLERIVEDLQAALGASHKESGELKQVAHTFKTERDEAQARIEELESSKAELEMLLVGSEKQRAEADDRTARNQIGRELLQNELETASLAISNMPEGLVQQAKAESVETGHEINKNSLFVPGAPRKPDVGSRDHDASDGSLPDAVAQWLASQSVASSSASSVSSTPSDGRASTYNIWTPPALTFEAGSVHSVEGSEASSSRFESPTVEVAQQSDKIAEEEPDDDDSNQSSDAAPDYFSAWEAPDIPIVGTDNSEMINSDHESSRKSFPSSSGFDKEVWELPDVPVAESTSLTSKAQTEGLYEHSSSSSFEQDSVESTDGQTSGDGPLAQVHADQWLGRQRGATSRASGESSDDSTTSTQSDRGQANTYKIWTPPVLDFKALASDAAEAIESDDSVSSGSSTPEDDRGGPAGSPASEVPRQSGVGSSMSEVVANFRRGAIEGPESSDDDTDSDSDPKGVMATNYKIWTPPALSFDTLTANAAEENGSDDSDSSSEISEKMRSSTRDPSRHYSSTRSQDASSDDLVAWEAPDISITTDDGVLRVESQRLSTQQESYLGLTDAMWELPFMPVAASTCLVQSSQDNDSLSTASFEQESVGSVESATSHRSMTEVVAKWLGKSISGDQGSSSSSSSSAHSATHKATTFEIWTPPVLDFKTVTVNTSDDNESDGSVISELSGLQHGKDAPALAGEISAAEDAQRGAMMSPKSDRGSLGNDGADQPMSETVAKWLSRKGSTDDQGSSSSSSSSAHSNEGMATTYKIWTPPALDFNIESAVGVDDDKSDASNSSRSSGMPVTTSGGGDGPLERGFALDENRNADTGISEVVAKWLKPGQPDAKSSSDESMSSSSAHSEGVDLATNYDFWTPPPLSFQKPTDIAGGDSASVHSVEARESDASRIASPTIEMENGASLPDAVAEWLASQSVASASVSSVSSTPSNGRASTYNIWTPPALIFEAGSVGSEAGSSHTASPTIELENAASLPASKCPVSGHNGSGDAPPKPDVSSPDHDASDGSLPDAVAEWLASQSVASSSASSVSSTPLDGRASTYNIWTPPALTFEAGSVHSVEGSEADSSRVALRTIEVTQQSDKIAEEELDDDSNQSSDAAPDYFSAWEAPDIPIVGTDNSEMINSDHESSRKSFPNSSGFDKEVWELPDVPVTESTSLTSKAQTEGEYQHALTFEAASVGSEADSSCSVSPTIEVENAASLPVSKDPVSDHNGNDDAPFKPDVSSRSHDASDGSLPDAVAEWLASQSVASSSASSVSSTPSDGRASTYNIWTPPALTFEAGSVHSVDVSSRTASPTMEVTPENRALFPASEGPISGDNGSSDVPQKPDVSSRDHDASDGSLPDAVAEWLASQSVASSSASSVSSAPSNGRASTYNIWTPPALTLEAGSVHSVEGSEASSSRFKSPAVEVAHENLPRSSANEDPMSGGNGNGGGLSKPDAAVRDLEASDGSLPEAVAEWLASQSVASASSSSVLSTPSDGRASTFQIWTPPAVNTETSSANARDSSGHDDAGSSAFAEAHRKIVEAGDGEGSSPISGEMSASGVNHVLDFVPPEHFSQSEASASGGSTYSEYVALWHQNENVMTASLGSPGNSASSRGSQEGTDISNRQLPSPRSVDFDVSDTDFGPDKEETGYESLPGKDKEWLSSLDNLVQGLKTGLEVAVKEANDATEEAKKLRIERDAARSKVQMLQVSMLDLEYLVEKSAEQYMKEMTSLRKELEAARSQAAEKVAFETNSRSKMSRTSSSGGAKAGLDDKLRQAQEESRRLKRQLQASDEEVLSLRETVMTAMGRMEVALKNAEARNAELESKLAAGEEKELPDRVVGPSREVDTPPQNSDGVLGVVGGGAIDNSHAQGKAGERGIRWVPAESGVDDAAKNNHEAGRGIAVEPVLTENVPPGSDHDEGAASSPVVEIVVGSKIGLDMEGQSETPRREVTRVAVASTPEEIEIYTSDSSEAECPPNSDVSDLLYDSQDASTIKSVPGETVGAVSGEGKLERRKFDALSVDSADTSPFFDCDEGDPSQSLDVAGRSSSELLPRGRSDISSGGDTRQQLSLNPETVDSDMTRSYVELLNETSATIPHEFLTALAAEADEEDETLGSSGRGSGTSNSTRVKINWVSDVRDPNNTTISELSQGISSASDVEVEPMRANQLSVELELHHRDRMYRKKARYSGPMINGVPHGQGVIWFVETGSLYIGEFDHGEIHGVGIFNQKRKGQSGNDVFRGDFIHNEYAGPLQRVNVRRHQGQGYPEHVFLFEDEST